MIGIHKRIALATGGILVCILASCRQKDCDPNDIQCWVNRLDTINSVYDPTIKKISDFGESVIPFVLEKIKSKRRLTSLGAAWVFQYLRSEKAFVPLLDVYESGIPSTALTAIRMILEERRDVWQPEKSAGVDSDRYSIFQSLLKWAVNGDSLPGSKMKRQFTDANLFKESQKGDVIISTDGLNTDYRFELSGYNVHIFNKVERQQWADTHGDYLCFKFRDVCLYSLPESTAKGVHAIAVLWLDMPWNGSKFSKVIHLSGGGAQTFWIKRDGKWYFVAEVARWIS